jgi:hypothetical protein
VTQRAPTGIRTLLDRSYELVHQVFNGDMEMPEFRRKHGALSNATKAENVRQRDVQIALQVAKLAKAAQLDEVAVQIVTGQAKALPA